MRRIPLPRRVRPRPERGETLSRDDCTRCVLSRPEASQPDEQRRDDCCVARQQQRLSEGIAADDRREFARLEKREQQNHGRRDDNRRSQALASLGDNHIPVHLARVLGTLDHTNITLVTTAITRANASRKIAWYG